MKHEVVVVVIFGNNGSIEILGIRKCSSRLIIETWLSLGWWLRASGYSGKTKHKKHVENIFGFCFCLFSILMFRNKPTCWATNMLRPWMDMWKFPATRCTSNAPNILQPSLSCIACFTSLIVFSGSLSKLWECDGGLWWLPAPCLWCSSLAMHKQINKRREKDNLVQECLHK